MQEREGGKNKNSRIFAGVFIWQGQKDSNPQQRFWRPTCYHYTMPLIATVRLYENIKGFVKQKMHNLVFKVQDYETGAAACGTGLEIYR